MGNFKVTNLALDGVKLLEPVYFSDNRGYSAEAYNTKTMKENGIETKFLVDYQCLNIYENTIRGIHFQNNPKPQTKLVRCLTGEIMDVVIDLRKGSPTYLKWITQIISDENRKQIYIPNGFGHAFVTKKPNTIVLYKFDDYYDRNLVRAIAYNDPQIAINWGITDPVLSTADMKAPKIHDSDINLTMELND